LNSWDDGTESDAEAEISPPVISRDEFAAIVGHDVDESEDDETSDEEDESDEDPDNANFN